jgi:4-amino-4-deoxy-L-arabinose transferase-like glycosyltransferase
MSGEDPAPRWPVAGLRVALALAVRSAAARSLVVPRDSVVLLDLARRFAEGDRSGALASAQHPLYPGLVGLLSWTGLDLRIAGTALSVAAGAAAVLPLLAIARRLTGPGAAVVVAVLYALSPYPARFAGEPLTDATHLLLVLAGVAAGLRALDAARPVAPAAASGALLGLAYLTRPEGLLPAAVLLVALIALRRGRARVLAPAALLLGCLLLAGPYLLHLRSERGAWTLTGKWKEGGAEKAEAWSRITGRPVSSFPAAALETGRELAVTTHPLLLALVAVGLLGRGRPRPATLVLAAVAALLLLAALRVHWLRSYLSHRHVLVPSVLLLAFAGRGLERLAAAVARRRPAEPFAAVLLVLVGAVCLPKALAAQGEDKLGLVAEGRAIAAAGLPPGPLALTGDPRIAFYAGRRWLPVPKRLLGPVEAAPGEDGRLALLRRAVELETWAKAEGALLYVAPDEPTPGWRALRGWSGGRRLPGGAAVVPP